MPINQEAKEIQQFDWCRTEGWPLGLHTRAQNPKVIGIQSAFVAALFESIGAKNLASQQ